MLDCKRGDDKKIREDKRPKSFNVKTNPSLQELVQTYYILYILANLVTIFLILLKSFMTSPNFFNRSSHDKEVLKI